MRRERVGIGIDGRRGREGRVDVCERRDGVVGAEGGGERTAQARVADEEVTPVFGRVVR